MRIPAWTGEHLIGSGAVPCTHSIASDRILYKGDALNLSVYSRAELKNSDHRPGSVVRGYFFFRVDSHLLLSFRDLQGGGACDRPRKTCEPLPPPPGQRDIDRPGGEARREVSFFSIPPRCRRMYVNVGCAQTQECSSSHAIAISAAAKFGRCGLVGRTR